MGTIAQKLEYLNGTKQALKESINNLGGDITSETTFREYAQELDNIYDNLPKTTGEDTNLSLTTLKGKMNTQIKGDTSQDGTPTPSTPIDIEVVTGTQVVTISNSDNTETQTQTLSLGDIELCKIGTYQDYLYKSNDKWYKRKNINKDIFDGSDDENWQVGSFGTNSYSLTSNPKMLAGITNEIMVMTNLFKGVSFDNRTNSGNNIIYCDTNGSDVVFYVRNTSITSLANFKTLLSTTNMNTYYVLATPNDIEITNTTLIEQLDNLQKLKSYNGTTNISSNGNLPMVLGVSALKGE